MSCRTMTYDGPYWARSRGSYERDADARNMETFEKVPRFWETNGVV